MPLLGFGKHRLHPDLPLANRFLVRLGRVVAAHLLRVTLIDRALDGLAAIAGGALGLERTGAADDGIGSVDDDSLHPLATLQRLRFSSSRAAKHNMPLVTLRWSDRELTELAAD